MRYLGTGAHLRNAAEILTGVSPFYRTGRKVHSLERPAPQSWLVSIEPTGRPATFRRDGDLLRRHAVPVIGGVRLVKLSPLNLQRLSADRLAAGLSSTTVHHLHAVIHRAIKQAMR